MRKLLALVLLAGVSSPALAAGDPGDVIRSHADRAARQEARAEARQEAREERSEARQEPRSEPRMERSRGDERPHFAHGGGGQGAERAQAPVQGDAGSHETAEPRSRTFAGFGHGRHRDGGEQSALQPVARDGANTPDTVRDWRPVERRRTGPKMVEVPADLVEGRGAPTLRESERPLPHVFRNRVPIVSSTPREGTQPPLRVEHRNRDRTHWNTNWRHDRRHDWRDHRRHHRSLFHIGFYYDPFGWNYRPYSIGWRLWPSYYSSRYWINDPWMYRLPYAPPGYRWVRYWDDAILVDTWSGQVVDVIHDFFW
jgi:Ni/Co efflux regulator RcnB